MQVDLAAMSAREFKNLLESLNSSQQADLEAFMQRDSRAFRGKMADMNRIRRYMELEELMLSFRDACDAVIAGAFHEPTPRARNAMAYVDVTDLDDIDSVSVSILREMYDLADDADVTDLGDCYRISFVVWRTWTDGKPLLWDLNSTGSP